MTLPDFSGTQDRAAPFPHFLVPELLSEQTADALLDWLDLGAPWALKIADFYEQHEFSLIDVALPDDLSHIASRDFVSAVGGELSARLEAPALTLVDISAHRLLQGQTIRIHNDNIGDEETHRLVVQLNHGWAVEQGGLLMLFSENDPESVTDVMIPAHRSAFGFEISAGSFHAVSTIHAGRRDTLVYTFRKAA